MSKENTQKNLFVLRATRNNGAFYWSIELAWMHKDFIEDEDIILVRRFTEEEINKDDNCEWIPESLFLKEIRKEKELRNTETFTVTRTVKETVILNLNHLDEIRKKISSPIIAVCSVRDGIVFKPLITMESYLYNKDVVRQLLNDSNKSVEKVVLFIGTYPYTAIKEYYTSYDLRKE